jgi:hypothetical protein
MQPYETDYTMSETLGRQRLGMNLGPYSGVACGVFRGPPEVLQCLDLLVPQRVWVVRRATRDRGVKFAELAWRGES